MEAGAGDRRVATSDAGLVAQALAGNQAGFSGLIAAHRDGVYRLVRNHLGDDGDALDVTQESFVSAFAALGRYDPDRPFRTWILGIALNKCRDWARRRKVRGFFRFARPIDEAYHVADTAPDPEAALVAKGETERLRRAIAALPAQLKEPLILCAIDGLDQTEAAAVLGISRKAVETRIYRARQKLMVSLEG